MTRFLVCSLFLLGCAGSAAPPVDGSTDPVCDCEERICGSLDCGAICGTCPSGSTCASDGLSCIAPLPVGTACATDRQCGVGRICLRAELHLPGGYCTRACSETEPCPAESACGMSRAGQQVCVATCGQANTCRASEGYTCVDGTCDPCVGSCEGLECGDDGCGGECRVVLPDVPVCDMEGDVCSAGACEQVFTNFANLTNARWDMSALLNSNGEIVLVGGRERTQYSGIEAKFGTRSVRTVEVFDPDKKEFKQQTDLPTAIARPHAALVEGTIYVAGGTFDPDLPPGSANEEDSAATVLYKQNGTSWDTLDLPEASTGGTAESIDKKLYLLPGAVDGVPSDSFWVYRDSEWEALPSRPTARTLFSSATDGKRLWVVGGWNGDRVVATVETWSAATGWATSPDLPVAVAWSRAVFVGGKIFVFGGFGDPYGVDLVPFVQEIDAATGRTRLIGSTRDHLTRQAPAVTRSGQVLLFGAYKADLGVPIPRTDILEFLVP